MRNYGHCKNITFCHQCKVLVSSIEDLFFIEDKGHRGFCSEKCIEGYFNPIVRELEKRDDELRKTHNLENEGVSDLLEDASVVESVYSSPDEIWCMVNELEDCFYSYIKNISDEASPIWMASICFVFNNQPSFVFSLIVTKSETLLNEYRIGEKYIEDKEKIQKKPNDSVVEVDDEMVQSLDRKKSVILAELLSSRTSEDIPYERFEDYVEYMTETMDSPDEVFSRTDSEGDKVYHYIRAHEKEGECFYYIVLCLLHSKNLDNKSETVIPIIAFPSIDPNIYKKFRIGKLITGNIKN